LRVLVRLEARTAGHLVVDLLLEQRRVLPEQLAHGHVQPAGAEQAPEARVDLGEPLDALDQTPLRLADALLVVDPVPARRLRQRGHLIDPARDLLRPRSVEETRDEDEPVPAERRELLIVQCARAAPLRNRPHLAPFVVRTCSRGARSVERRGGAARIAVL
jgi:hypothetical protein